jgi:hypothetical protein
MSVIPGSELARLNSRTALPMPLAISGSFLPPKKQERNDQDDEQLLKP